MADRDEEDRVDVDGTTPEDGPTSGDGATPGEGADPDDRGRSKNRTTSTDREGVEGTNELDDREDVDRWDELDRAREALLAADERATGRIHEQLESLEAGVFEEEEGEHTRSEPGPKADRVAEVAEKLDALADRADDPTVGDRIRDARDHLRRYLKNHPQGG